MIHQHRLSFNTGLTSPAVSARVDVEKIAAGCRILQNMLPRTNGGAFKRPGTVFLGRTKDSGEVSLMPFNYSLNTRFVFEFGEGYVRFWKDQARVYLDVLAASTWSGTTTPYNIGTPVWKTNVLYRAASTHTPSGGNTPPSASWTTTSIEKWVASTAYSVGDIVVEKAKEATDLEMWVCKTGHTSALTFSSTNWGKVSITSRFWFVGLAIATGMKFEMVVSGNVRVFRCKKDHTSALSNKPGSGSGYTTYWEDISTPPNHSTASKVYKAGDVVKVSAAVYVATSDHTSSASNEPTDGGAPWVAVTGISAWSGTSTSRAVGDWVWYGGDVYKVTVAVTTGSYISSTGGYAQKIVGYPSEFVNDWSASPEYAVGDVVVQGVDLYVCFIQHSTSAGYEPGTTGGDDYWQQLGGIKNWVTSTNYVAGQYVFSGGQVYLVVSDHTAGTLLTDVSSGLLEVAAYPLEIPVNYSLEQAKELGQVQVNDQTWLLHGGVETQLLERYGDTVWRVRSVPWDNPPMRDENIDDTHTLTASATTGDITLTSSEALFEPSMVGGYFSIAHQRVGSTTKVNLNAADASSPVLRVLGRLDIFIYGTAWTGTVSLMTSKDGSTNWLPLRTWEQPVANMRTISTFSEFAEETYIRLDFDRTAGAAANYAVAEAANSRVTGLVKIDSYISPSQVQATVVKDLWSTGATTLWAEGAYSNHRGWPRAGTVHDQRLVLVGSGDEAEKCRMSRYDGFFDFLDRTSDDGAIAFQIASRESNALMWVESFSKALVIGSLAEEWTASSGVEGKIITPSNPPRSERQTRRGSAEMPATLMGEALVFIGNDRQHVYEFSYSFTEDKHVSQDLTQLAEYWFGSGIKRAVATRHPEVMLICVMNDGTLRILTYNREQQVAAWSLHNTAGSYEDAAVIYGGELNTDEVWFVVKRDIDGQEVRYMEAWDKNTSRFTFDGNAEELVYCDSAVSFEGPVTTLTGLEHLEGADVIGIADGVVFESTVSGGQVTLEGEASSHVVVGLPMEAKLQGGWLEAQLQDGSSLDRKQRTSIASVFLFQSGGAEYHPNPEDTTIQWVSGQLGDEVDIASRAGILSPQRFRLTTGARHEDQTNLTLRSSFPLPLNVIAIVYGNEYFG